MDQWGMDLTQHAYPGVSSDEGESSDASTSTNTSSDSGNEVLDMDDLQDMDEPTAAETVWLQYRHHKRRWRRFRGKPVRSLRRHVRRFANRRRKGQKALEPLAEVLDQARGAAILGEHVALLTLSLSMR